MKYTPRNRVLVLTMAIGFVSGCKVDPPASLYDPNYADRPAPAITTIDPPAVALAAVTTITITGSNFSPDKTLNQVYFDDTPGTVMSASATQLTVISPILIKDSVAIRVSVMGATLFSNIMYYKLAAAVAQFGVDPQVNENPYGIDCDTSGALYASLLKTSDGSRIGIIKFTPAGARSSSPYSPPPAAPVLKWSAIKMGPGGVLYAAWGVAALYRIPAGGGAYAFWPVSPSGVLGSVNDIDFDASGNLWAAGNGTKICRVTPAGTVKAFPFTANIRAVRVFNGALYIGGLQGTTEAVWRSTIVSSDSITPPALYYDNSAHYAPQNPQVTAITFAIDGDMYVGTDATDGILVVKPTGAASALYPGLLGPTPLAFAWGAGTELYASRGGGTLNRILRINTLKQGAPYYGRRL